MAGKGRLIFEYRHGGDVSRIEREVGERSLYDPTPDAVRAAFIEAAHDLLAAAGQDDRSERAE